MKAMKTRVRWVNHKILQKSKFTHSVNATKYCNTGYQQAKQWHASIPDLRISKAHGRAEDGKPAESA